jgi:nucleoside-diphosphate-sugar epimerase
MKVAITGASGFIGTALCRALAAAGHQALPADLEQFTGADAVVHLAAIAHRRATLAELHRINVELAARAGYAAAAAGANLVFLSSAKVHGEHSTSPFRETSPIAPRDAYAESKARAEDALRAIPGLRLAVLRPPLVYGPGVKANFLRLMKAIARGVPLPLASLANRRSLIYVGNLVDAIQRCLNVTGTYLLCDGLPVSTPALCRAVGHALQRPARLFRFPPTMLPLRQLACSLELDDSAIRRELGWQPPFSFEEGLRATAHWYRSR